jgi:hypothetical protein
MNIKRPLMPGFLKKADQKLLLNKPGIWSTRIHLVLYYGVLFMLLLALVCFLEPTDVRGDSNTEYWTGFVSVISGIGIIVWLIYLLRFNVFKKYGNINRWHGLGTFILYFISSGVFVLFPFVHPVVESVRANMAYSSEEIVRDINAINLKICQLEYPIFQTGWEYDTVAYVKSIKPSGSEYETVDYAETAPPGKSAILFYRLDSARFFDRLSGTDSLKKINDTLYLMYRSPSFNFINSYYADNYTKGKVLSAFELFSKVYRHPPAPAEREKISNELGILRHKYLYYEDLQDTTAPEIVANDDQFDIIIKKYQVRNLNNSISNIIFKKYRWETRRLSDYVRLFYYFTLGISLLIFIFRHSTIRTFFLTLLTGVLLTILTTMVFAFSHADESVFFPCMFVYLFLFFLGSWSTWRNKKRYAITGILINLFVILIPVLPMLIAGWIYALDESRYHADKPPVEIIDWNLYFFLAEIGGALLLLVLLATYIGKVYRHWYSLPED